MTRLSPLLSRTLALALTGLVLALLILLVVLPVQDGMRAADERIVDGLDRLDRFGRQAARLDLLRERKRALDAANGGAIGLLPGDNPAIAGAAVQQMVTAAIETAGGAVQSLQPLEASGREGPRRVGAQVQAVMTIDVLQTAIAALENGRPSLTVDRIELRPAALSRGADATTPIDLLVRFDAFGLLEPPSPARAGG